MGLDMFMTKQTEFIQNSVMLQVDGQIVNSSRITAIIESVGHWRNFRPMHIWMVDNLQDGKDDQGKYWVDTEDLEELKEYLEWLKKSQPEHLAECERTIGMINNYLTEDNITEFTSFYYQAI